MTAHRQHRYCGPSDPRALTGIRPAHEDRLRHRRGRARACRAEILREAGDALFFCEDIALDDDARDALARVSDLAGQLVGAERWDPELAEQVMEDLEACGPPQLVRLGDSR